MLKISRVIQMREIFGEKQILNQWREENAPGMSEKEFEKALQELIDQGVI